LDGGDMRNCVAEEVEKKMLTGYDAGISDPNICTEKTAAILL